MDPTDPAHLQTLDPADPAHPANQNQIFGTPGFQPSQENIDNYSQEFLETHWVPSHHYTYFEVPPPEDRRLQCLCAHEASLADFENHPDDYEAPDEEEDGSPYFYKLRCTNAITEQDYAGGWRLCRLCRPPPGDVRERAAQVCELARDRVELLDRSLHRRLHYGAYTVNLISRIQHMPDCRCECPTCRRPAGWNSGWDIHLANWVAHTDVAAFISGERPWPNPLISRPVANRRVREGPPVATRRVRQRRQRVEPEDYDTESHLD
jgi:hypothetical protein